ncbi:MAG: FAD-dependent oxidoreductase [Tannerella sp.]|nr:FAD-dependent oxidoreductase [Tannerella sp.]
MGDEKSYDCVVVGGGISGVTFAYYLNKAGKEVLLLDDKLKAGGQIQTGQSVANPDYRFEMGAHTCYNSYIHLLSIVDEMGWRDFVQPLAKHGYVVYAQNKIKTIFSELSVLQMIPSCFKCFSANKTKKTVSQFFRPIVGGKNYDRLFRYAFSAVICQPADDYPAEIFLKKRNTRDKTFPRKFSFKQGFSSFIDLILNECKIENVQSSEILNIDRKNGLFVLNAKDGKRYQSKNISLATDPKTSSSLLTEIDPEISSSLSTIPLFHSESLNVIISKDKLNIKETAGIINLSDEFMSAVSRDLIPDERFRSFTFHFKKDTCKLPEKIHLICKVLGIHESDITEQKQVEHILPIRDLQSLDIEKNIDDLLKNKPVYLTGNYFKGLAIEDCITRSKCEAERFLTNNK